MKNVNLTDAAFAVNGKYHQLHLINIAVCLPELSYSVRPGLIDRGRIRMMGCA